MFNSINVAFKYLSVLAVMVFVTTTNSFADDKSSIYAVADVTVSDGLTYTATTSFLDRERQIFQRDYAERIITMGRAGFYAWQYDGKTQEEISAQQADFVNGHQFHAQILYPESFIDKDASVTVTREGDTEITVVSNPGKTVTIEKSLKDNRWTKRTVDFGDLVILFTYHDWKDYGGRDLPSRVGIDDGSRLFTYAYNDVTFGDSDKHAAMKTPYKMLNDSQKLMRAHNDMIDAHIESDESLMNAHWGDNVTIVSGGTISVMDRATISAGMASSLKKRRHSRYVDLTAPNITISDDGTLAWIAVQVAAEGVRLNSEGTETAPLSFVSAWIETYEKQGDKWLLTSNASNFQEN